MQLDQVSTQKHKAW